MRNACDSDSRCGSACDASAPDAKSLAMRVERCEPLSQGVFRHGRFLCDCGKGKTSSLEELVTRTYFKEVPNVTVFGLAVGFTAASILSFSSSLSAPKSQRFLRFAIAMPIADPRNRAIAETRESNAALRFKGAMESR